MADERQFEFFLLRYVPNAVKDEFVNLGVVLLESGTNGSGFADARFIRDWRRVRCLDPEVDIDMLEAMQREVQAQLSSVSSRDTLLKKLVDQFSNAIQVSSLKACLAAEPAKELETLASLYVDGPVRTGARLVSGRQEILTKMREAFEQAGLWKILIHNVSVAAYTKSGDPLRLDFAYRVGESLRIFHATSLRASVDQAVMLASRYPTIAEAVYQKGRLKASLTAIVDDGLNREDGNIQFALGMMEEARIRVEAAARMPAIAEITRQELSI